MLRCGTYSLPTDFPVVNMGMNMFDAFVPMTVSMREPRSFEQRHVFECGPYRAVEQ